MPLTLDPGRHKSLLMCHDHLQQDGLTLTRDMTGDGGDDDIWSFLEGHGLFGRAEQQWMVNFRADDLDWLVASLTASGIALET